MSTLHYKPTCYETMKGEKTVPYILVWDIIILVYNDKKAHDTEVT